MPLFAYVVMSVIVFLLPIGLALFYGLRRGRAPGESDLGSLKDAMTTLLAAVSIMAIGGGIYQFFYQRAEDKAQGEQFANVAFTLNVGPIIQSGDSDYMLSMRATEENRSKRPTRPLMVSFSIFAVDPTKPLQLLKAFRETSFDPKRRLSEVRPGASDEIFEIVALHTTSPAVLVQANYVPGRTADGEECIVNSDDARQLPHPEVCLADSGTHRCRPEPNGCPVMERQQLVRLQTTR